MLLDETDRKILFEANKQNFFVREPFKEIALRLGLSPEEVVARLDKLKKSGLIRRFGAKINPIEIGLRANAMIAWKVPSNRVQEVGDYLSHVSEITHCYERETIPGKWDYNLYVIMHSQKRKNIEIIVRKLSQDLGIGEYVIILSKTNLKTGSTLDRVEYRNGSVNGLSQRK